MAPRSLTRPLLGRLAELVHRGSADAGSALVLLGTDGDGVDLAFWPVPDRYRHPADPLIGFVVPDRWDAIALLTTGQLRPLDGAVEPWPSGPVATRVTSALDRRGSTCSIIDGPDGPRTVHEPPVGWVPDAMARALGLATPAPEEPTSAWVEAQWLDRIAPGVLGSFPEACSWDWLVSRHPLAGNLPRPDPPALAARTFTYALDTPWSVLRRRNAPMLTDLHGGDHPMGPQLAREPAQWFDDGAYARWVMHQLPPVEALLDDLVSVLRADLADDLLDALVSIGPWS